MNAFLDGEGSESYSVVSPALLIFLDWELEADLLQNDIESIHPGRERPRENLSARFGDDDVELGTIARNFLKAISQFSTSIPDDDDPSDMEMDTGDQLFMKHIIPSGFPGAEPLKSAGCALGVASFSGSFIFLARSADAERDLVPFAQALHYVGEATSWNEALQIVRSWESSLRESRDE